MDGEVNAEMEEVKSEEEESEDDEVARLREEVAQVRAALDESVRTAAEEGERRELQARNERDIWLYRGFQAATRAGKGKRK